MGNSTLEKVTERIQNGLDTARRLGASGARLSFGRRERIVCFFESGRLKTAGVQENIAYNIEVLVNGRMGATTGNDLADIETMIKRAVALAAAGSVAHFDNWPAPRPIQKVKTYSEKTAHLSRETMIESGRQIVDALKNYNDEMFINASAERSESEGILVTTGGLCHTSRHTSWMLGAYAQRTEGTDMLFAGYSRSWKDLNEFYDPDFIAGEILEDLRLGETLADAPEGKVRALLSPEIFGMILEPVMLGVNGRNVARGDSPLRDRLGERILSPKLTLIDDPHLDYSPGATEIDSNGVPTRKMNIVTEGVLEAFLYDLDSAGLAGAEPTGHDGCSPHFLTTLPGERHSDEMLASLDDGIFIKGLLGFGMSNMINGDFSGNVCLGYRVKNGRIVGRVKNTMIAGNVYELLKENVELSRDRDPVIRLGHALVEGLRVSAARAH